MCWQPGTVCEDRTITLGDAERLDRMRLARTERIGAATYRRLMLRYGTAPAAIAALPDLARAGGGTAPAVVRRELAEREFDRAERAGATILFVDEPGYPPLLGLLHDAPAVIAVLGDAALLSVAGVAIVGSRNASANGCSMAEALGEAVAGQRLPVVSGLARGIDAAAHEGALRAGTTIAAVAGGLDKPYPPQNIALQQRIAESGAVLSEAPFGTAPQARHFPRRNRIIAGLSLGVVVIEAARRSGSLITARMALEHGRELFAVPGSPLDPRCLGSNDLIRQGAHLTETLDDILSNLPEHPLQQGIQRVPIFNQDAGRGLFGDAAASHMAEPPMVWNPSPDEMEDVRRQLEALLSPSPTLVDDLIDRCQVSAAAVGAILLELELAGRVQFAPGQRVMLIGANSERLADPD
jgi:DNA processing protein